MAQNLTDEKQQARVRSLFHRQLQVPLADGAAALAAYQTWETSLQPGFEVSLLQPSKVIAVERCRDLTDVLNCLCHLH